MSRAFSLMEVLIVVALFGGLFIFSIIALNQFSGTKTLDTSTIEIASVVNEARSKAMGSVGASSYGIHFTSSTVTLFKGETYNASDPDNQITTLSSRIQISAINFTTGGSDIVFARASGKVNTTGNVVVMLVSDASKTRTITIEATGLIRVARHVTYAV
ncbi:hypothetical protein A3D66_02300 [Candidatus Kaiserbacteria bacterium RIFCSPHIGHO2_02_FULL_50_9]|uniref:General secretion pathway GspH domain-containing protein n=1 Tax=Candidatus Kaiserbacteria bacterium RIFCSPLOWO2_01_FULL_51_21 TaxID=1798508 RepID=A0A1F6ECL7_9BACT|nr:MAG: hypothetical protein A2761_01450 [Candidatus Kaiserbacteria bacterium RIFCSPHIGHO2_01_FULL_51_33]OGG63265.1 MAG: hypothetical protein A3D66_02300 [Candidatus Kaiserbacteria bacterium RIFCSPHIGHO2_02_FULL_50_9]OGG71419.1 MAG: hypothetical protein A3A35_01600 [Candidatus Kaiserbacteria bacterium RIFCSPLOWO2_01_FULL_51_21]